MDTKDQRIVATMEKLEGILTIEAAVTAVAMDFGVSKKYVTKVWRESE